MKLLVTFAALSLGGAALLSLLPEGGIKQTAGMVIGLLTLMCWAEGLASLLGLRIDVPLPGSALAPTALSVEAVQRQIVSKLAIQQEETP